MTDRKNRNQIREIGGGKLQPQAVDLESWVLGTILKNNALYHVVSGEFLPELFYKDANQKIAEAIMKLMDSGTPADTLTVTMFLKKKGELDMVGGNFYINQLSDMAMSGSMDYNFRIVQQQYIKRQAILISSEIIEASFKETTDVFDIIDKAEMAINVLTSKVLTEKSVSSAQLAIEVDKRNKQLQAQSGLIGITTGFADMDKKTGGWQKQDLIILAGRPGMGKTSIATQLLMHPAIKKGTPTAFFSLEMSRTQIYLRMKSQISEISLNKFLFTGLNVYESQQADHQCSPLYNAPIEFDDQGALTLFQIRNKARKLKRDKGIELLVIDYLQLIRSGTKTSNREAEVSEVSRGLKALAKELDIPIIVLAQLSRAVEARGGDKRPILSDLRESGSIEQDADMVIFAYRPEYYGITEQDGVDVRGKAAMIVAKFRNGSPGDIILNWKGEYTKFYDNNYQYDFTQAIQPGLKPDENF